MNGKLQNSVILHFVDMTPILFSFTKCLRQFTSDYSSFLISQKTKEHDVGEHK